MIAINQLPPALEIDLHGYHPNDIDAAELVKQAWEMGAKRVRLIHGHGYWRGSSPGFVHTNTGHFGLTVRSTLRHNSDVRKYAKVSTLYRGHEGSTSIDLKPNPNPTRTEIELPPVRGH